MDYLPASVHKWIEGSIDPHSQQLIETYSQTYLIVVTIVAFLISYTTGSVLLSLEVFLAALVVLLLVTVPPWSMYQRRRVKFLPVRKS